MYSSLWAILRVSVALTWALPMAILVAAERRSQPKEPETRPRLAVADFKVVGDVGIPDAGKACALLLLTAFDATKYQLIERSQLQTMLNEMKLQMSDLVSEDSVRAKMGRIHGVKYLVIGEVTSLGGLNVTARIVECQTGRIGQRATASVRNTAEFEAKMKELAAWLCGTPMELSLKIEPEEAEVTLDGEPVVLCERGRRAVVRVTPGGHLLEVRKTGYASLRRRIDIPPRPVAAMVRLGRVMPRVKIYLKSGRAIEGEVLSRTDERITVKRIKGRISLRRGQYDRIEELEPSVQGSSVRLCDRGSGGQDYRTPTPPRRLEDITWALGPELPEASSSTYVGIVDGSVVCAGTCEGDAGKVFAFDPATKNWHRLPDMPERRAFARGIVVGSAFYVVGGRTSERTCSDVFRLSIRRGRWRWDRLPDLKPDRAWHALGAWRSWLIVAGGMRRGRELKGYDPRGLLGRVEYLDVARPDRGWARLPDIPGTARGWTAAAVVGDRFYLFGGMHFTTGLRDASDLSEALCLDLGTQTWTRKRELPYPFRGAEAAVLQGRYVLIAGGSRGIGQRHSGSVSDVFVYDTEMDTFARMSATMPHSYASIGAGLLGDRLYVAGGTDGIVRTKWFRIGLIHWRRDGASEQQNQKRN